jgi:hypothetical protein
MTLFMNFGKILEEKIVKARIVSPAGLLGSPKDVKACGAEEVKFDKKSLFMPLNKY